jgi:spore germination protein YaaH
MLSSVALLLLFYSLVAFAVKTANPAKPAQARGLVQEKPTYNVILKEFKRYSLETDRRFLDQTTLAFVTPWYASFTSRSTSGANTALLFRQKFSYISPTWYRLKRFSSVKTCRNGDRMTLTSDADGALLAQLKDKSLGTPPKIVPRFNLDGMWFLQDYHALITVDSLHRSLAQLIADECTAKGYNGIVLDGFSAYLSLDPDREHWHSFIVRLANFLHNANLELLLVVPAATNAKQTVPPFGAADFSKLALYVDYFVLAAYEYGNLRVRHVTDR